MAGRRPKPTALHLVQGGKEKTHRAENGDEPKPEINIPPCPDYLDKEAKKEWERVSQELYDLGIITNIDRSILASYCQNYSIWVNAIKKLNNEGMFLKVKKTPRQITTGKGKNKKTKNAPVEYYYVRNDNYAVSKNAHDQWRKDAIELGMTPSARSRVKVDKTRPIKEPFSEFMKGKDAKKKN